MDLFVTSAPEEVVLPVEQLVEDFQPFAEEMKDEIVNFEDRKANTRSWRSTVINVASLVLGKWHGKKDNKVYFLSGFRLYLFLLVVLFLHSFQGGSQTCLLLQS